MPSIFGGPSFDRYEPGDVWWVDNLDQIGTMDDKGRPVVILSFNADDPSVVVMFLKVTTKRPDAKFPKELLLDWASGSEGLARRSYVQVDMARQIPIEDITLNGRKLGHLTERDREKVDRRWESLRDVIASRGRAHDEIRAMTLEVIGDVSDSLFERYGSIPQLRDLDYGFKRAHILALLDDAGYGEEIADALEEIGLEDFVDFSKRWGDVLTADLLRSCGIIDSLNPVKGDDGSNLVDSEGDVVYVAKPLEEAEWGEAELARLRTYTLDEFRKSMGRELRRQLSDL